MMNGLLIIQIHNVFRMSKLLSLHGIYNLNYFIEDYSDMQFN
jgi:hypothetical protein